MLSHNLKNAVEYTKKLVEFDTYGEAMKSELLRFVEDLLLKEANADVALYNAGTCRPYLIASLKAPSPCFTLMLEGHIDVVSPQGMSVDPFTPSENGDIITGRGTADMKSGCAAMITAFIAASKDEKRKGNIYLVLTSDEEYSSEQIIEIMDKNLVPNCDFVMIAEPTNGAIFTAHKGNAWLDVEFFGKSAHASTPDLGINSICMASEFIEKLRKNVIAQYDNMYDELYGIPTINIGVISGGSEPNIVPPYTKLRLDKRYLPGDTAENFVKEVDSVIKACIEENPEFNAAAALIGDWSSVVVSREDIVFKNIKAAIDNATGKDTPLKVGPFWGEGGFIQRYGVPVIYYGSGSAEYAHTPNEQCSISQINEVTEAYYSVIKSICF